MLAYIAGPLFSEEQRKKLEQIEKLCKEGGFSTFLPHRDAGLWDRDDHKEIFEKDLQGLKKCDLVVALVEEEDCGTSWEIGYAYSNKIKVIALGNKEHTDIMLKHSAILVETLEELDELLTKTRKG